MAEGVLGDLGAGAMVIADADQIQRCGPGDVFVMRLGSVHREEVGAAGCQYLYGSRPAQS